MDAQLATEADPARIQGIGVQSVRIVDGKLCIHPSQVSQVNTDYLPTEEDVAWAVRVLEASDTEHGAAIAVDGKMVDRPIILKAQKIISLSIRIDPFDKGVEQE